MYIALKTLLTKHGHVQIGEEVQGVSEWPYPVLKAHLDDERIKWVPAKNEEEKPKRSRSKK